MLVEPAQFVQWVASDADAGELIDFAKAQTYVDRLEHALVRLTSGKRVLIRVGPVGIRFSVKGEGITRSLVITIQGQEFWIDRIEWHTHPRVTGPSDGDLEALEILGQNESVIHEIGGDHDGTRIRPKPRPSGN